MLSYKGVCRPAPATPGLLTPADLHCSVQLFGIPKKCLTSVQHFFYHKASFLGSSVLFWDYQACFVCMCVCLLYIIMIQLDNHLPSRHKYNVTCLWQIFFSELVWLHVFSCRQASIRHQSVGRFNTLHLSSTEPLGQPTLSCFTGSGTGDIG